MIWRKKGRRHVHFPDIRRFSCWQCRCGEVYQPTDLRSLLRGATGKSPKWTDIDLKQY